MNHLRLLENTEMRVKGRNNVRTYICIAFLVYRLVLILVDLRNAAHTFIVVERKAQLY